LSLKRTRSMVWAWTAMLLSETAKSPQMAGQRQEKIDVDTGSSF
jgi:hypothetical protein